MWSNAFSCADVGRGASSGSPLRVPLRAVLLDEGRHRLERLHRVGIERMLVEEGVLAAPQQQQFPLAAGTCIFGGEALGELARGPFVLDSLDHNGGRQIDLLAALDRER